MLEKTKREYELQQQRKTERQKQLRENRFANAQTVHNIPALISMEERGKLYSEKAERRRKEKEAKQLANLKKIQEEEKRRRDSMLFAKLPASSNRVTKSVVARANLVSTN